MNLSGKTTLNLYVNFLLENLPSNVDSFLQVCDCNNFVVVKGQTSHTEVMNLIELNKKFEEKYPETKLKNTIDLIKYDSKFEDSKTYEFVFYNSPNLNSIYENENSLFTLSDFPWGSSWNQGKLLYFYFKFITHKIPASYFFDILKYKVVVSPDNQIDFTIEDNFINNQNDVLKSAILDCFDFNLHEFETNAKKMDLENSILNPSIKESIMDISVKDFIIL
jgi:hypothetical protein